VVVLIKINKNGKIVETRIEKSSGNSFYDESALRTISKIRKFSPPPVIKGNYLNIGLIFNLKELQ
jgi:TonB family protein